MSDADNATAAAEPVAGRALARRPERDAPGGERAGSGRKPEQERYAVHEVWLALREARGLLTYAAIKLGCSRQCVWEYTKRYPELAKEVRECRENMLDVAESKLYGAIDVGEPWAVSMFLRTQGADRGYAPHLALAGSTELPALVFTFVAAVPPSVPGEASPERVIEADAEVLREPKEETW